MACCTGIKEKLKELIDWIMGLKNVYVAYADAADGTGFSLTQDGTKKWIQFISVNAVLNPPTQADFTGIWSKYIGEDGPPGGGVETVTGLNTDNTDPNNPAVKISVDGVTVMGDGTPGNPLTAAVIVPKLGQFQFNGDPTIPVSGELLLDWNTPIFDNGNYADPDTTKIAIDTTGYYRVTCRGNVNPSGNELQLLKNGAFLPIHVVNTNIAAEFTRTFPLNAGDYLQVKIVNATPGEFAELTPWSPYFEIERVG